MTPLALLAFLALQPLPILSGIEAVRVPVEVPVGVSAGAVAGVAGVQAVLFNDSASIPSLTETVLALTPPTLEVPLGPAEAVAVSASRLQPLSRPPASVRLRRTDSVAALPESLPIPRGAKGVSLDYARSPADVERLIPKGTNSWGFIEGLKRAVRRHGELPVYTYRDAVGGKFVALDVGTNPSWVDNLPELHSHERSLIKKILRYGRNVQVVVREEGKTPDLIVDGVVTEMKSLLPTRGFPTDPLLNKLLHKANHQALEFTKRHLLVETDLALDLNREAEVPVDWVEERIGRWASGVRNNGLQRIWVFAGEDRQGFVLQPDGTYKLQTAGTEEKARPRDPELVHGLQLLAKKGRLEHAHRILRELEAGQPAVVDSHSPVVQAREQLEAQRALPRIRKLARTDLGRARETWEDFRKTHSESAVQALTPEMDPLLSQTVPAQPELLGGAVEPSAVVRELEEPPRKLRERGVQATVAIFGSARIPSPEQARKEYEELSAKVGKPKTQEDRQALALARRRVEASRHYGEARKLGGLVAAHGAGKVAVVTGGGPGIMEAANRGAFEAGGPSVGYNIHLPEEQALNSYVTPGLGYQFENFATRKINLRNGAAAFVFFPGGFGTMDELFEVLTHIQTRKMRPVPIVLVGDRSYWRKALNLKAFVRQGLISEEDLGLFRFAKDAEEAWSLIDSSLKAK